MRCCSQLTEAGEVVSEATYRLNVVRSTNDRRPRRGVGGGGEGGGVEGGDDLRRANDDRQRFLDVKKQLEQMAKTELVQQVKVSH